MDMFQMLKDDHARVKTQLQECIGSLQQGMPFKPEQMQKIGNELLLHMKLEEQFLYPVMQKKDNAHDLVDESYQEHQEARALTEKLMQEGQKGGMAVQEQIRKLLQEVEHHVQEEENELFPLIKRDLPQQEIDRIGQQMLQLKQQQTMQTSNLNR